MYKKSGKLPKRHMKDLELHFCDKDQNLAKYMTLLFLYRVFVQAIAKKRKTLVVIASVCPLVLWRVDIKMIQLSQTR